MSQIHVYPLTYIHYATISRLAQMFTSQVDVQRALPETNGYLSKDILVASGSEPPCDGG